MDSQAFTRLVGIMTEDRPPRVWSLLVTVFGELAQDSRSGISGAVLARLTEMIGIKPEAVRVALHRLRRDGWIESVKSGRTSNHRLGRRGRMESAKANPAIYLSRPVPGKAWLVIRQPSMKPGAGDAGEFDLGQGQFIAVRRDDHPEALCLPLSPGRGIPEWLGNKICGADLRAQSALLEGKLERMRTGLEAAGDPTPLQVAVLRVLVVHEWRRLILKAPNLPGHLFPEGWRGEGCKGHLEFLLTSLEAQDIGTIERDIAS